MAKACTFAKSDILSILSLLDREYKNAYRVTTTQNTRMMKVCTNMAVMALGGWIEDGIDNLTQISIDKLRETKNQNELNIMVKNIYGFSYKNHLARGIIYVFGAHGLEQIEKEVGDKDIAILSSSLAKIKNWRDVDAHSLTTRLPCNPGMVTKELNIIFPILK